MVRPSLPATLLAFAATLSLTPARATELPDDRLRLTVGMVLLEFGGSGWEDLLANGGYGDVRYSPAGWFSDETDTVSPDDSTGRAEMFFADLSYVVGPWWGVGLAVDHNVGVWRDAIADWSWIYLPSDLSVGARFTLQWVPDLVDGAFLHTEVQSILPSMSLPAGLCTVAFAMGQGPIHMQEQTHADLSDCPECPLGLLDEFASHGELTLEMSSIWAIEDCELTAGNPGEFRYRLILRMPDEFGNQVVIHDTGSQEVTIQDGERQGIVMDPVSFRRPNDPDAAFQVEFWIGEYDGSTADFENHSWVNHRLDSGRGQMWAAGSSYETDGYTENADGSGNGLMKFSVWNESDSCKGAAYYYVTWTPVWM